ncbi:uncharacterized protein LOC126705722 [Quercus robur]|uniref:uncharacterized protein LOC126705722 n=1 Tax=Quercus robur TaxID=38942 RepID=UPI0021618D65|nr:uncharacterized protein LOC126705722 [Quercus robur]
MKKPSQPPKIKDKNESLLPNNEKKPLSSSSPSTSSSSSSISPNPNQNPNDTVPVPKKITRDLPNLSECHACGLRTDTANPNPKRQRLQTLRSEWRIVLLCNKCFLRVNSSHICSYCFLQADHSSFLCRLCNRRVHSHCFHNNRHVAPWSYASSDEFSVCVDCWVPKPIALSRSRSRSQSQNNFKGNSDESSRVLPEFNSVKSLQDAANDASSVAKNKIEAAVKAREEAVRKALVARKAVELANTALDLVASDANNKEEEVFIDDVELAFRLHRVMNSSPRISSNFCSLNTSCLAIVPRSAASGNPSVCGKLQLCSDNKLCENPDKSVSEPSVCVRPSDGDGNSSNSNGDDNTMDSANLSSGNECKPSTTTTMPKDRYRFKYCRFKPANVPKDRYRIKYCRCKPANVPKDRYRFKYCRCKPARPKDRYRVKYCRRNFRLKTLVDCKQSKFSCDGFDLVNEGSASAPAPGLVTACSNESMTISNATLLQCCVVPLQPSGCASGSFQDQSSRQ